MSLFQNSVLNKYLDELNSEQVKIAWEKFKSHFLNPEIQENIRNSKEEQYQGEFLIDLFVNVFGYIKNPTPNFNLTTELKNIKDSKKADGAILKNDEAIGVIELKGTDTIDLAKVETQAFGYKNNHPKCIYVISSNFEKLRFYIDNAVEFEEFNLFKLDRKRFDVLWLCLSADNLLKDLPKRIKDESLTEGEIITKKLYKNYSQFRNEIFDDIYKNNPKYNKLTLFKKTQKLLDRFLFILFAEDRLLLPPNSISIIIKDWKDLQEKYDEYFPLYDRFKKYFGYLNEGYKGKQHDIFAYNGGLFLPDEILDNIKINDELLSKHTKILSNYDFASEVSVNILGHIFEHSLTEIESIQAELEGAVIDKSKTKRKKDGVFYTPTYITKYMVDNTVGKLCTEKKAALEIKDEDFEKRKGRRTTTIETLRKKLDTYREWLLKLTICDPSCGSGAFLNQALEFLIAEHHYIDELYTKLEGFSLPLSDLENSILENNLFGVDINEESVEIAKLSLWLRTAQKGRKLTTLNNNIKCGNSLIDDPEIARDKSFHWNQEFPKVFQNGGFDVVIGNPPYVDIKALDNAIVKHLFQNYKSANNRVNLYSSFIEKSLDLLGDNKHFSFIIPSSLLTQESYKELRKILLEETTVLNIVRLPNESFGGGAGEVKVDTIILTYKKGIHENEKADILIYKGFDRISEISTYNSDIYFSTNPFDWKQSEDSIFRINVDNESDKIISKIEFDTIRLIECAEFCLGLTPYDKYKGHSQEQIKNRVFHSDKQKDNSFKKLLAGNDITRYNVEWDGREWISYGNWLGAPRESRFFNCKRILVKQIIDWSDKRIWSALTSEELYNTQNAFNLIAKDKFKPEYLIALINSKLISFYHRKKFLEEFKDRFQKILIKDAKEFPIKNISISEQEKFSNKVDEIISNNKKLKKVSSQFARFYMAQFSLEKQSRKLQNWYELEFGDFIKELNKAINETGREKLTKSEELEWMEIFETKKAEAQTIKSEIDKTDCEIDKMVYELYGLTEDEIAIIEKSLNYDESKTI